MIKFLDLHKINERFRNEIDSRIKQVLDSGWYLLGNQDKEFENMLGMVAMEDQKIIILI